MDPAHPLRAIDLNLLVVLDALLAERHVTRAGRRVGLSQSATSNALERLRVLFGDPILERVRGAMVPTPRAQALRPLLERALSSVATVVAPPADLTSVSQTIRLSVVDYGIALTGGPLLSALRHSAPGLDLVVTPWSGPDVALAMVDEGALDLAVTVVAPGATGLRWKRAYSQRMVVAMRRGHPAARGFSFERWLRYPHVVVSGRGEASGSLDAALALRGATRRVGIVVPSFLAVPALLADSDLLAVVPDGLLATRPYPRPHHARPASPRPPLRRGSGLAPPARPRRRHHARRAIHRRRGARRCEPSEVEAQWVIVIAAAVGD